ncbi:hypothetical protein ACIQPP_49575 [Streptomyces violaceusniger]|uniref:hypothetical protein n=1 Tax=Streptomyces violaceusniger TaxID=68280 RepID=UPI000997B129|nr:hypothetical protein [Streptomyces hygroscopicus]AQW48325.1 hypothetical protein SHXM_01788 [Streptomyces hygroscopicus]
MPHTEEAVTSAVYALADRALTRALLTRIPKETVGLLEDNRSWLPPLLVDEVIASRDPELRAALASSASYRPGDLFGRLAALGDPALAELLYGMGWPTGRRPEQRRAVWAGAAATADDSGWRAPDGLPAKLLATEKPDFLLPALHSPFPDLVAHALARTSHLNSAEVQLRTCRWVLACSGAQTALALAEPPAVRRSVAETVRRACASANPDEELAEAIRREQEVPGAPAPSSPGTEPWTQGGEHTAEADSTVTSDLGAPSTPSTRSTPIVPSQRAASSGQQTTAELIDALRDRDWRRQVSVPDEPEALDWDALIEAHRAGPFCSSGLYRLWGGRRDCPEELAVAAFASNPPARHSLGKRSGGALHWPMLTAVDFSRDEESLHTVLPEGIASGVFPVDRVMEEIGPARHVLNALPHSDERVRSALASHVARLGSDFANWRALHTLLPRFKDSVRALVDAALAVAPEHVGKAWPNPLGPEFPPRHNSIGREAWLHLFDRADKAAQLALSAHMDARAIQHLLVWHQPDRSLRDHLVATHGSAVLAGLASHWNTPAEVIEDVITYDDPEINAALFLHTDLTDAQRRHVLAGWLWGKGAATPADERLPLTPALVKGLKDSARRNWLLPVSDSGDPLLCRILLGSPRVKLHTDAQHLLMLMRLWERHGPDEVRALLDETDFPPRKQRKHPLPSRILTTARAALDAADGLAALRAAQAHAASPEGLVVHLRVVGAQGELAKSLDLWAEENSGFRSDPSQPEGAHRAESLPWAELLAAHRTEPLPDRLLVDLKHLGDCPADLVEAAAAAELRLSHRNYTPRRGKRLGHGAASDGRLRGHAAGTPHHRGSHRQLKPSLPLQPVRPCAPQGGRPPHAHCQGPPRAPGVGASSYRCWALSRCWVCGCLTVCRGVVGPGSGPVLRPRQAGR